MQLSWIPRLTINVPTNLPSITPLSAIRLSHLPLPNQHMFRLTRPNPPIRLALSPVPVPNCLLRPLNLLRLVHMSRILQPSHSPRLPRIPHLSLRRSIVGIPHDDVLSGQSPL